MRRCLAAIAATLLLLAGCADDPKPVEPKHTTPTSTPTVPALPKQATEDSVEGVAAFATYWMYLVNHAAVTGDAGPMLALSPNCEECIDLADDAVQLRFGGKRVDTALFNITELEPYGPNFDYVEVGIADNPKFGFNATRFGMWIPGPPPYVVRELWRVTE